MEPAILGKLGDAFSILFWASALGTSSFQEPTVESFKASLIRPLKEFEAVYVDVRVQQDGEKPVVVDDIKTEVELQTRSAGIGVQPLMIGYISKDRPNWSLIPRFTVKVHCLETKKLLTVLL